MAELSNLAQVIAQFNAANGTNINPQAPWLTPGWDLPNNDPTSLHARVEDLGKGRPDPLAASSAAGAGGAGGLSSQLFSSPDQLAAFAPQSYQAFGSVPYIDPTTSTAAQGTATTVDPSQVARVTPISATAVGTGAAQTDYSTLPDALKMFQQQIATGLAPQFERQTQSLNESLAGRGLFNSGAAVESSNDLAKQQDSALAQALAPLTEQFASYYQSDQQGNTANLQQSLLANQAAANSQTQANQGYENQAQALNQAALNQFLGANQQAQNQQSLTNQQYQQQTGQANQQYANAASAANAAAYGNATQQDMSQYNAFLQQLMAYQQSQNQNLSNQYLGSYGANNSAISLLGQYGSGYNPYASTPNNGAGIGSAITGAINSFGKKPAGGVPTDPNAPHFMYPGGSP